MKTKHYISYINKSNKLLLSLFLIFLVGTFNQLNSQDIEQLKNQKPFQVSGNVEAGANYYSTSDTVASMPPLQWMVGGMVNFSIYGINIPISVALTSQNRSFRTPFNRIGLSPYYKWAKIHLGWRGLNFNSYTLGGQQINGAGFELTPGKFRVAFMYGKLNNAITDISLYNNLNNQQPVYDRNAYAFDIGVGGKKSNLSLSILQASDNLKTANVDIKEESRTKGVANLAVGLKGQVSFLKYFKFQAEAATSVYTRNVESDSIEMSEDLKNNFLFKRKIIPPINYSTTLSFAGNSSLSFTKGGVSVALQYVRVDPDYKSLGAFFMETDVEQYSIAPSFVLWKGKLVFNGSFGYQRNNLYDQKSNDSHKTIGMASVTIMPSQKYGFTLQYSNYGISQQVLSQYQNPMSNEYTFYDSIRISQVSQSYSFNTFLNILKERTSNIFSLNINVQDLRDNNNLNQGMGNFTSMTGNLNYNLQFTDFDFDINQNLMYINSITKINSIGNAGYTLGLTKGFLLRKSNKKEQAQTLAKAMKDNSVRLNLNVSANYYINLTDNVINSNTTGVYAGLGLIIASKHSFNFNVGFINNKFSDVFGKGKRNDLTGMVRYGFRF